MKKAARAKGPKTTDIEQVEKNFAVLSAKSQFFSATANLGLRLAVTVVVPIVAGVKLDERFNSAPSLTLLGLFFAIGAGSTAVWATIKQVNAQQFEVDSKAAKKIKRSLKRA